MLGKYILDDDHQPIACEDLMVWGQWMETAHRVVEQTALPQGKISTVFLGLDHQFTNGPPLLFETMVFGGPLDGEQNRYSTWDDAVRGHAHMVKLVEAI